MSRMRREFFWLRPYFVKNECAPHLPQAFFLLVPSGRLIVSNLPHGDLVADILAERPLLVEPGQNGLCPIEKCDVVACVLLLVTESCKAARIPKIFSRKWNENLENSLRMPDRNVIVWLSPRHVLESQCWNIELSWYRLSLGRQQLLWQVMSSRCRVI